MKKICFFGLCLIFVLLGPVFGATSIGGTIDKTYAQINKGDLEKFEISVFSLENITLDITVSRGDVEDLQVDIVPKNLEIQGGLTSNPTGNYNWFIIKDKYIRLYPIQIYIKAPQKITKNHYSIPIIISSTQKSGDGNTEGVIQKVVQSLQYTLKVYIPGSITRIEEFVNLTESNYNWSDYPAYQLPRVNPTNYYNPPEGGNYENVPSLVKQDEDIGDSLYDDSKDIPTGYLFFNKEGGINWFTVILGCMIILLLVFYLLKK